MIKEMKKDIYEKINEFKEDANSCTKLGKWCRI
jgi:hypothetical protein